MGKNNTIRYDNRGSIKINSNLHERMKKFCNQNDKKIGEEYEKAISIYLETNDKNELSKISLLDDVLEKYFSKLDKHLSSMMAKNGIDTSIILIGLLRFLSNEYEQPAKILLESLKKDGIKYFTNKEDEISFLK